MRKSRILDSGEGMRCWEENRRCRPVGFPMWPGLCSSMQCPLYCIPGHPEKQKIDSSPGCPGLARVRGSRSAGWSPGTVVPSRLWWYLSRDAWQCPWWVHPAVILSGWPETGRGLTSDDQFMGKRHLYPKRTGGNWGSCLACELNWFKVTTWSCFSSGTCLRVRSASSLTHSRLPHAKEVWCKLGMCLISLRK